MLKKLKFYCLLLVSSILIFPGAVFAEDIHIALRSHQDTDKSLAQWQPTADYLSEKIPGYRFIMVPFTNISAMNQAISSGDYQFSLANPSSAIEYILHYEAKPLVTLVNKRQGKGYSEFGSVIFTRADNKDINRLKDLKGKSFVAVDEQAFGGWRVAWFELLKNKINPFTDFKVLRFAGGKQQDVVYTILHGKADAGTVRTDMLERMVENGEIDLNDFKIIGEKKSSVFPFMHSTDLYPEWLFSTAGKVDSKLKDKVVKTLLSISVTNHSAMKGKYVKWIQPLDYTPVEDLLKELKVGPYNIATMGVYQRFVLQYGLIAVITVLIITGLVVAFLYVLNLNKQILSAKESLKNEVGLRNTLERQLLHSQRIESLGQLTGGVAHDFNNMLASISGFTELALAAETVKNDKKLTGYLNQVMTASDRCAALVNQMLVFSRAEGDTDKKEEISVANFIHNIQPLLQATLPSNINLQINDVDENLFLNSNSVTMTQIIMSLYLNAKDAIADDRGTITIGAGIDRVDALEIFCDSCHQDIRGDYIYLYVKDTGCGIDVDTSQHLFDPFFSTKEVGKGRGMGLSVVHGITHKQGGHILVESEIAKGTTIKILLPLTSKEINQVKDKKASPPNRSTKHIMIVDDEIALTVYLSEFLQQKGFKTTAFNSSKEALDYFEVHAEEFDLVITDESMPDLTGTEIAIKMMSIREEMPVILCSGYSDDIDEKIKSDLNIRAYVNKPIQSDKLLQSINSLLNSC